MSSTVLKRQKSSRGTVDYWLPSAHERGEPARLDILSIDISGETAVARVRDDYLGLTFVDSLSLLLADGRWRIYNKLFNVEGPATVGTPGVD